MQNAIDSTPQNSGHPLRIEICGGIASGKTTLAILLKRTGIEPILENFQTNPFWEAFYRDPAWHAFETEISFLLQHYHQIKVALAKEKLFACDFSLLLDLSYANVTLGGSKLKTFLAIHSEVSQELGLPDLLVHLRCGAAAELERIRKRGRAVEASITLEYLGRLNDLVERQVSEVCGKAKVVSIDSEHKNFADDETVKEEVLNLILKALPGDHL